MAIADYNTAISLNPQHSNAYYNRGLAYADQGQLEAAIASFQQGLAVDPNPASRQQAQEDLDKLKAQLTAALKGAAAIADYIKAIELNLQDADAYYNRGVAQAAQGQLDEAIRDFEQGLTIDPNPVSRQQAQEYLAELKVQQGQD
jgi:tetratricopeptide (TPR) repeat protein